MHLVKHILICHNFNSFSYAANSVALAYELAAAGHQVVFLSHDAPEFVNELPPNLTVLRWPGNRPVGWQAFRFVQNVIRQYKIDTLLAHAAAFNVTGLAGRLLRVPNRFGYYHSIYASTVIDNAQSAFVTRIKKWRKRFFIHCYSHMICVSKHAAKDLQLHFDVPSNQCSVVYNSLADRGSNALLSKVTPAPVTFFLPTRLDPGKNILSVIDGFIQFLQNSSVKARLLIAGFGLQEKIVEEKSLQSNGAITFLGFLPYQFIDEHIQAAHYVVCSTLQEAFGMVNIEAMMLGTPVLANATGGIPEIIEHKKNGLLVNGYSAEDWAHAFNEAMMVYQQQPSLYESMRQQARQDFCKRFQQQQQLAALQKILLAD